MAETKSGMKIRVIKYIDSADTINACNVLGNVCSSCSNNFKIFYLKKNNLKS